MGNEFNLGVKKLFNDLNFSVLKNPFFLGIIFIGISTLKLKLEFPFDMRLLYIF